MLKRLLSAAVVVCLSAIAPLEAQRTQKIYELIYQDIQTIKQQLLELNQQVQQNREDIQILAEQLSEVLRLTRDARRDFAGFQAEQKSLPAQYQILLERYDAIRTELAGITERLMEIQRAALTPAQDEGQTQAEEQPSTVQDAAEDAAAQQADESEEKPKTTLPPNLSPQEVYNMARSDYLKGNFQLAIQGFTMYKEHFPDSPLVDNAQYWIGECYFSQESYEDAISKFNDLILNYPQGDKIAAAYLKKGFSLANLGRADEALAVLKLLVNKFPLEDEAKIAQQKIQELEKLL